MLLISVILEQFASIIAREAEQEIRLVVGVDEEVRKLEGNLRTVHAVLKDAEKRQVTDKAVKLWLKKLEDVSYEMDDVLDEWNTAMIKLKIEKDEEENTENAHVMKKKVCSFIPSPSCCFRQVDKLFLRHDIAHKIKELSGKLDEIVRERERYGFELTTRGNASEVVERPKLPSFVDVSKICGRDNVRDDLREASYWGRVVKKKEAPMSSPYKIAFFGKDPEKCEQLEDLGRQIAKKCKGLPLAAKTLGSLMRFKRSKLINLRHLILENGGYPLSSLEYPRGFGRLTSLRRLSHFYVSGTKDGCKLGELKDLNQLEGSLEIKGVGECGRWYRGTTMSPNWTMSLTKLKTLRLDCFKNLEHLPPLGKLPVLESLIIRRFNSLRKVGVEFLGIESENKKEDNMQIFPNLKSLKFYYLNQWEEWIGIGGKREEEEDSNITIMPRLQQLGDSQLPKLNSLPDFLRTIPLKELEINCVFNPILQRTLAKRDRGGVAQDFPYPKHQDWMGSMYKETVKKLSQEFDLGMLQSDEEESAKEEFDKEIGEYEQTIGTCLVFTEEGEFSGILVMFDCSCNRLKELPSSIGRFLESSNLKEYPMEACKLHLSVQDLSNNSLAGLPPEMGKVSKL
uniref:Rx N-terminal domain-containing protein n=1 Tax=Fagus sylvatica TaxID=28930 RepID=A0A2N9GFW4_FAGSY